MLNVTQFNISDFNGSLPVITEISIEELACISLNDWMLHTGIVLLILYVIITWTTWWYFQHGWKKWPYNNKFLGNSQKKDNRLYWAVFIRDRFMKVCIGYIGILVYLTLSG